MRVEKPIRCVGRSRSLVQKDEIPSPFVSSPWLWAVKDGSVFCLFMTRFWSIPPRPPAQVLLWGVTWSLVSCQAARSRSAPPAACRRLPAAVWGWEMMAQGSTTALSTAEANPWDKMLKEERKHLQRFCTTQTNPAASTQRVVTDGFGRFPAIRTSLCHKFTFQKALESTFAKNTHLNRH